MQRIFCLDYVISLGHLKLCPEVLPRLVSMLWTSCPDKEDHHIPFALVTGPGDPNPFPLAFPTAPPLGVRRR